MRQVVELVYAQREAHPDSGIVVVVSAMAGETDRLIALAKSAVSSPTLRELDLLMATGEQTSVALVSMLLNERGIAARGLTGGQAGLHTDSCFGSATIERIDPAPLRACLASGTVAVVAGFQGVTQDDEIATLGRGGSDITAVAVASALRSSACYIYTDVDGVYSADPRICPKAKRLARISHEEMLELASLGAKVLHPRSVYFAMRYQVPLVVLSTFKPDFGTWIVSEEELMEQAEVTGIASRTDEAKLTLIRVPKAASVLHKVLAAFNSTNINVDMISQAGYSDGRANISFTVLDDVSSAALKILNDLVPELGAEGAEVDRNITKVSVVGVGIRNGSAIGAKIFEVLAQNNIEVEMIGATDIKISLVVARKYGDAAVRALHQMLVK